VSEAARTTLLNRFVQAIVTRDKDEMMAVLATDAAWISDGGGKVSAARKIVTGPDRVGRIFYMTGPMHPDRVREYIVDVNGEKGVLTLFDGDPAAITTFEINDGQITGIYRVMNPEKLKGFAAINNSLGNLSQI